MEMIATNLIGQASILAGIRDRTVTKAISIENDKMIDLQEHDNRALQYNNFELKSILGMSFDVIDSELSKELVNISSSIEFLSLFKDYLSTKTDNTKPALDKIQNTVNKYFQEYKSKFEESTRSRSNKS